MLKLMTEQIHDVNLLTEEKDGQKEYFIEGIFMQQNKRTETVECIHAKLL